MKKLFDYLKEEYDITETDGLVNANKFMEKFKINDDLQEYKNKVIKAKKTYITDEICCDLIKKHNKQIIDKLFLCDKCDTIFSKKHHLEQHLNRKKTCIKEDITCEECNKKYSNKKALKIHKETAKHLENVTKYKNSKIKVTGNNNTTTTTINNIDKVIILNFSDIKNSQLITEDELEVINTPTNKMIQKIINKIRFNEKKPESHNVRCTNRQSKKVCIFQDGEWSTEELRNIADELIIAHTVDLQRILEKHKVHLTEEKITEIKEFIESLKSVKPPDTNDLNDYYEACRRFLKQRNARIEKIMDIIYDGTQKLGLKNPLKK